MGLTLESINLGESFPCTYFQRNGEGQERSVFHLSRPHFDGSKNKYQTLAKSEGTIYIQANTRLPNVAKMS